MSLIALLLLTGCSGDEPKTPPPPNELSTQLKADYAYMVDNSQHLVTIAMGTTQEFASDDLDLAHVLLMFNDIPVLRQGGLNHFIEVLPRDVERAKALLLRFGRLKPYVDYAAPHVVRPLPQAVK